MRLDLVREIVFDADDEDAVLQLRRRQVSGRYSWQELCSARCTTSAYAGEAYRVGGAGILRSPTFIVPSGATPLVIHARTASHLPGIVMAAAGGGLILATITAGAVMASSCEGCTENEDRTRATLMPIYAFGLTAVAVGVALLLTSRSTVEFGTAARVGTRSRSVKGFRTLGRGIRF
jgi:hypothetical protein